MTKNGAFAQQRYSFHAPSASVQTCALARTAVIPVDIRYLRAFERNLRRANLIPPLIILALHKLPKVAEGCVFVYAELLYISCAFVRAVHARHTKVWLRFVDPEFA